MGKSAEEILEEVRLKAKKAAKVYNHCTPNETLGESIFMSGVDFVISAIEQQPLPVDGYREAAIEFAEWVNDSYTKVESLELKKWAWVNFKEEDVMLHGSDYHFTTLINEVGKTTEELYNLFLASPNQEQGEKQEQK